MSGRILKGQRPDKAAKLRKRARRELRSSVITDIALSCPACGFQITEGLPHPDALGAIVVKCFAPTCGNVYRVDKDAQPVGMLAAFWRLLVELFGRRTGEPLEGIDVHGVPVPDSAGDFPFGKCAHCDRPLCGCKACEPDAKAQPRRTCGVDCALAALASEAQS